MNWTDQEIKDYYGRNWTVTLQELSRMTGRTVRQLKKILMGGE